MAGGLSNQRNAVRLLDFTNSLLTRLQAMGCIRAAMDLGTNLLLPKFLLRDNSSISQIRTEIETPLSFLFDTKSIIKNLREACPEFHVAEDIGDLKDSVFVELPENLQPKQYVRSIAP